MWRCCVALSVKKLFFCQICFFYASRQSLRNKRLSHSRKALNLSFCLRHVSGNVPWKWFWHLRTHKHAHATCNLCTSMFNCSKKTGLQHIWAHIRQTWQKRKGIFTLEQIQGWREIIGKLFANFNEFRVKEVQKNEYRLILETFQEEK